MLPCAVLGMITLAPDEWTMVPLLVKLYKLVINELSNQIEKSTSTQATTGDEDEVCVKAHLQLSIILLAVSS